MRILPHEQHMTRARLRELRAERLRARFAAVSRAIDRAAQAQRRARIGAVAALAAALALAAAFAFDRLSPWSAGTALRHIAAGAGCDAAHLVGLAPALRGQPGYWRWNDSDSDGKACETSFAR